MVIPRVYGAIVDTVRDQSRVPNGSPAIRLENGRELAAITLSGYTIGSDLSPAEWRDIIVSAVNSHDALVKALGAAKSYLEGDENAPDLAECLEEIEEALDAAKGGAA